MEVLVFNNEKRQLKSINIIDKINNFMINYEKQRFTYYYYAFVACTFFSIYLKYKSYNAYYVYMKYVYGFLFTCSPVLYMYMMHHLFKTKLLDKVQYCSQIRDTELNKMDDKIHYHYYNNEDYEKVIKSYYDSIEIN